MSPQLKLQQRDDPLAVGDQPTRRRNCGRARRVGAGSRATPPEVAPRAAPTHALRAVARRVGRARCGARDPQGIAARGRSSTYDDDRLEQTGWRIYESIVAAVRDRAQELTDAGVPTSAAALAAATLHSRLPKTVEEGTEVMRAFRQASAGRARARRGA